MSKLIKSNCWSETLPCRLEPVDLDSLFLAEELLAEAGFADETVVPEIPAEEDPEQIAKRIDSMLHDAQEQTRKIRQSAEAEAGAIISGAHQEKEQLLQDARLEAEKIIAEARDQAVALKEQARQEGETSGRAQARQAWQDKLSEAAQLIAAIETERYERVASSETELLGLASAVAEKIIGAELKMDRGQHLELVRQALSRSANAGAIELKVHPEDSQWLSDHLPELRAVFNGPTPLRLASDESIPSGGCYIETERGSVDARIKVQLERVFTELLKAGNGV